MPYCTRIENCLFSLRSYVSCSVYKFIFGVATIMFLWLLDNNCLIEFFFSIPIFYEFISKFSFYSV